MSKKGTYNGGSTVFVIYPSAAGKPGRSKLGGLQIAAKRFAENPPPMFPLYPADAKVAPLTSNKKKKRRKFPPIKGRRILE